MERRLTFDKSKRLRLKRDFDRVFGIRCSSANRHLILYVAASGLDGVRLGVQVSRRFGSAPRRNRAKRWIREVFRSAQWDLPAGFDYVCILRPGPPADFEQYRASFLRLAELAVRRWRKSSADHAPSPDTGTRS